jgi:hypothetical protein
LQPFVISLRSSLAEKINLSASATLDPYAVGENGIANYNRFIWENGRFTPGRLTGGSISLSTNFKSKERNDKKGAKDKTANEDEETENPNQITDPTLLGDQQRLMDYMRRNPNEFVDFNIPWSVNLMLSLNFFNQLQPNYTYKTSFTSSFNFNGDFSLTPKWKFSSNGYLDLKAQKLGMLTLSINRDLHCWQMAINVTPIGNIRYFSFTVSPKASMLQDLRVNRTRQFYNF